MKAEYILRAMEAMEEAELFLGGQVLDPGRRGRLMAKLFSARIDLKHRSGLSEVEVEIESEAA